VHVGRELSVGLGEDALVVVQPGIGALRGTPRRRIDGQPAGERLGALLEQLDAGDLVAQRPLGLGEVTPAQ
jgi:hypothetical protein